MTIICRHYAILYKALEHLRIWVSAGVLEPVPANTPWNWMGLGSTEYDSLNLASGGWCYFHMQAGYIGLAIPATNRLWQSSFQGSGAFSLPSKCVTQNPALYLFSLVEGLGNIWAINNQNSLLTLVTFYYGSLNAGVAYVAVLFATLIV